MLVVQKTVATLDKAGFEPTSPTASSLTMLSAQYLHLFYVLKFLVLVTLKRKGLLINHGRSGRIRTYKNGSFGDYCCTIEPHSYMERDKRFELSLTAWKAVVLAANTNPACVAFFHRRLTALEVYRMKMLWLALRDSNPRPTGYEPVALTNWAKGQYVWNLPNTKHTRLTLRLDTIHHIDI